MLLGMQRRFKTQIRVELSNAPRAVSSITGKNFSHLTGRLPGRALNLESLSVSDLPGPNLSSWDTNKNARKPAWL